MSIIRLAARIALRKALLAANTLAEDRVYDSTITEIDVAAVQERKPLMTVITDDIEAEVQGRDILNADAFLDIVVEVACAAPVQLDTGEVTLTIPDTDAGYEVTLDILCRQVIKTIQAGGGEWGDLFRDLVPGITNHLQRRGADARDGTKFAARQLVFTARLLTEPLDPPLETDPLGRFLTMAAADEKLAPLATIVAAQFGQVQTSWEDLRTALGLSMGEYALMGVQPSPAGEETPGLEIDGDAMTGGGGALPPEDAP